MKVRITDRAWAQIVSAGSEGVRGKVFRMSAQTLYLIARERGVIMPSAVVTLYSVPIELEPSLSLGVIILEDR